MPHASLPAPSAPTSSPLHPVGSKYVINQDVHTAPGHTGTQNTFVGPQIIMHGRVLFEWNIGPLTLDPWYRIGYHISQLAVYCRRQPKLH